MADQFESFVFDATRSNLANLEQHVLQGFDLSKHIDQVLDRIIVEANIPLDNVLNWLDTVADLDYNYIFDLALKVSAHSTVKWVMFYFQETMKPKRITKLLSRYKNEFDLMCGIIGREFLFHNANTILEMSIVQNFYPAIVAGLCKIMSQEFRNDTMAMYLQFTHDHWTFDEFRETNDDDKVDMVKIFIKDLNCDTDIWYKWINKHKSERVWLYMLKRKYNIDSEDMAYVENVVLDY
jgi:hypothetical protein